ncbi:hypothetical protein DV736_g5526, partial [Chaetothyriales sp. CBS 134916]
MSGFFDNQPATSGAEQQTESVQQPLHQPIQVPQQPQELGEEHAPPLPARPAKSADSVPSHDTTQPQQKASNHQFGDVAPSTANFAPPPKRNAPVPSYSEDDPGNLIHTVRDPHKLVAYIIPLPTPTLAQAPTDQVPHRFLLYTPPPPPLKKPTLKPGEKEDKVHLVQRKWQEEVRKAKTSQEKTTSFKGIHHLMVRSTNKAINLTTSANLDFLGRAGSTSLPSPSRSPATSRPTTPELRHSDDGVAVPEEAKTTVPVDEILFIYPESMGTNETALREEFINTLMRTKSQAQRDSVIATGLVPIGFGIDFMLIVVGGLGEIATVWAFKSIMGAKTARSISKRLASSEADGKGQLKLSFQPSSRVEPLKQYLEAECSRVDPAIFPRKGEFHVPPTEGQVLEAIGWSPHQTGGETRNWEDEQWELSEVKDDWKVTMSKGAKEWKKWCHKYEQDWEKQQRNKRSEKQAEKPLQALPVSAPDSPFLQIATPARRLQSTAALYVDDNGEQHSSPGEPGPHTEDPPLKKAKKKSSNFRVWRPSPTAQLGMNALGKPSEVLLLSPRDRKIPVVPTEQDAEPKESFYETLASETQPSTWEQVKENISQARHQIQPQQGVLAPDAWAELKKTLVAGFTQKQLRRYLEEHKTSDTRLPHLPKMAGKDGIIKAIAKHVWRCDLPAAQPRSAAHTTAPVADKVYLLSRYSQVRQIALARAPVDNVLSLASKSGVSIEFGERHTTITGPSDQASEIRDLIQQQIAVMKNVQRYIPDTVSANRAAALVDTLAQKHGLFASLTPRAGSLELNMVCTPSYEDAAHRLYHELCLAVHRHNDELVFRSNLTADQELVWCLDYTPCLSHMLPLSKRLYRPHPRTISKPAELGRLTLRETAIPYLAIRARDPGIQIECTAEFGRGLFDNVKGPGAILSKQKLESSYPHCAFLPTMPVLQQFISGGHLDKEGATARNSDAIMTLSFSPLWPHQGRQAIHVDLIAPNNQHQSSAEQSLPRIHRIRVVEAQRSLCLLRPESVVDIKLSCRHWREVYSAESPTESALFHSVSSLLSKWLLLSRDKSSVSDSDSESVQNVAAPLLFLEQPPKHPETTHTTHTDDKKQEGKKKNMMIRSPASAVETYILSDFYLVDTESYSFQHKDRLYSVEHANLVAQNPNTPPMGGDRFQQQEHTVPLTPFYDRQTLTLRHIIGPSSPLLAPSAAEATALADPAPADKKTKNSSKPTKPTTSKKGKDTDEVEDFIGAALSLAKKWQTEAAKFRQRIEMVK